MRRAAWLVVGVVVVLSAACARDDRLSSDQARLVPAEGAEVLVAESGGRLRPSSGVRTLGAGDRVKAAQGTAALLLSNGDRLELATGTEVQLGEPVRLETGALLLVPGTARPLAVDAAGSSVMALGPARVTRDLAVTAASYRTGLRLESAGRRLRVPPLRQASIASLGEVPSEASPIVYDAADGWDRTYLADAAALATQLETRSRGFTASLSRGAGRTAGFYRLLLPALEAEPGFDEALLSPDRPAGETLVGTAIALEGAGGTFATRFGEVFAFRGAGADWGLVALDQGVDDVPAIVATVDQAIGRAPLAFAPPPSTRPTAPSSPAQPS
ncbi:MAG TPA: hypothetical protein VM264_10115, partial [Acidimicrobiales bacterium]|nr:hypothetical protein [Acidimicrobiales bacterium]